VLPKSWYIWILVLYYWYTFQPVHFEFRYTLWMCDKSGCARGK